MAGWIKLHRKLMDKAIWKESTPEQKTILVTLLMMANHEEKEWEWKGEKYAAEPGQFVTSLPKIAANCGKGITIQNVRTALVRFKKYEFLTDQSTHKNRLITIVNWGLYQVKDDKPNRQPNKQLTDTQQTTNRHLTANKNDKNNKNDKKNIKPPYPLTEFGFSSDMEERILLWLQYKQEKKDTYTETGFKALLRKIKKSMDEYGEQAVVSLMEESMSSNWKGIIWERIEKPLKSQTSANPFDELLRKELQNEQNRNNSPYEDNQRLLPSVLPEGRG